MLLLSHPIFHPSLPITLKTRHNFRERKLERKMICLLCAQSPLCIATIVFYTCIWIPFLQIKHALLILLGFIFHTHYSTLPESYLNGSGSSAVDLPVTRFGDLIIKSSCSGGEGDENEMCSVCLVEFEREDAVSQLRRCGHVFHIECIEGWVDRNNFTCPLCRSFLWNVDSCHAKYSSSSIPRTPISFIDNILGTNYY